MKWKVQYVPENVEELWYIMMIVMLWVIKYN